MKSLVREALWKYAYDSGHSLEHPQVSLLVDAMVEEELLQQQKMAIPTNNFQPGVEQANELIIKKYIQGTKKQLEFCVFQEVLKDLPKRRQFC